MTPGRKAGQKSVPVSLVHPSHFTLPLLPGGWARLLNHLADPPRDPAPAPPVPPLSALLAPLAKQIEGGGAGEQCVDQQGGGGGGGEG